LQHDGRCIALRIDGQFRCKEALDLILRLVGSIHNVSHKLRPKWKRHVIAVDVSGLLAVNKEEIVSLITDRHIRVLANLNISIGAENE
jgi:hypothetical protein